MDILMITHTYIHDMYLFLNELLNYIIYNLYCVLASQWSGTLILSKKAHERTQMNREDTLVYEIKFRNRIAKS